MQRVPGRMKALRHTVIKLIKIKDKDKILKATREKQQIAHKEIPIRLSADFSTETLGARRESHNMFKVMRREKLPPSLLYPARLSDLTEKAKALQTSKS